MKRLVVGLVALPSLSLGCVAAQVDDPLPDAFLEDTESWVMSSEVSGREYMISVALPLGYGDSTKTYPTVYVTDANGHFGTVVEAARMLRIGEPVQIPQLVIVGVGYPTGGRQVHARVNRSFDLSPTEDTDWEQRQGRESGGGAAFLRFLGEELVPAIEAEYRTDPDDRALYGHSLGGLFALYSVIAGDGLFRRAIAASPSLWWDDRALFGFEADYAESNLTMPVRLFVSMGLGEELPGDTIMAPFRMVSNLREFVSILETRDYQGLELRTVFFEEENHQSVVPVGISRGLRYIYDSPR